MEQLVLTDAERVDGAITKSRWMTLRDAISSTQSLGFRVDAVVTHVSHKTAFESELFMAKSEALVLQALFEFLPPASECVGCSPRDMAREVLQRLGALREAVVASELFSKVHSFGTQYGGTEAPSQLPAHHKHAASCQARARLHFPIHLQ